MRPCKYLFIFTLCVIVACSRKEKKNVSAQQESQPNSIQDKTWRIYKDSVYPVTIDYLADPKRMEVRADSINEKDPLAIRLKLPPGYRIDVDADFSEVDKNFETLEGAYTFIVYKYLKHFQDYVLFDSKQPVKRETDLNGTPAILVADPAKYYETYILLTPGVYNRVTLEGLGQSEQIAREALKHFHWTQPIDTNSAEFKAWKAHIWEILKSSPTPKK